MLLHAVEFSHRVFWQAHFGHWNIPSVSQPPVFESTSSAISAASSALFVARSFGLASSSGPIATNSRARSVPCSKLSERTNGPHIVSRFFVCLSRACLGKCSVVLRTWRQQGQFRTSKRPVECIAQIVEQRSCALFVGIGDGLAVRGKQCRFDLCCPHRGAMGRKRRGRPACGCCCSLC